MSGCVYMCTRRVFLIAQEGVCKCIICECMSMCVYLCVYVSVRVNVCVCVYVCVCVAFLNTYVVEEDGYLTFMKTFPNSGTLTGLVYLQYTKYNYGKKNSIWR